MKNPNNHQSTYRIRDKQGIYRTVSSQEIMLAAKDCVQQIFTSGKTLSNVALTRSYLQILLSDLEHEVFYVIWLDSQHCVLHAGELFRGTIDGASVYPREVVKEALQHNASAVIFAHNHPSGSGEPSRADENITQVLKEALKLIDVRVLDHFVVGETVVSLAERGLL